MNYTTQKGLLTELDCQKDFTNLGILLSQPIINDSRYDYLADINGKIVKIQCKTANPKDDAATAIEIACSSKNWNNGERHNYQNEIDYFYTSWKGQGYLIPIAEAGNRTTTLRFSCKSNTGYQIKWAEDYRIESILFNDFNYEIPSYVSPTPERKKYYCIDCGAEISRTATRCRKCAANYNTHSSTIDISREDLKLLIRTESFTEIGRKFNVSDNAIRKKCDKYNLPRTKKEINNYTNLEWEEI